MALEGLFKSSMSLRLRTIGLTYYFNCRVKEVRAWRFPRWLYSAKTAGVFYSDFEKDLSALRPLPYRRPRTITKVNKAQKNAGKARKEGKEYIVKDGDVDHFCLTFKRLT